MPDAIFAHPRLAPIYDAFDGDRDDLAAYLSIADELGADGVLDVGCGRGCLAVLLADSGRTVVGADPAGASLEVAKSKDATGRITWVQGDAAAVPASGADLAVMTGNVAQVFLTDEGWVQALQGIATAIRPVLADSRAQPGKLASGGSPTGRAGIAMCLASRRSFSRPAEFLPGFMSVSRTAAWHHSGLGSQRNRLIATKPPTTPQIARTSSWRPANPRSRANGFSSAWLNGRTGKTPARSLRNREVIRK